MHPAHIRRIGLLDGDPLGQLCVVWAVVEYIFCMLCAGRSFGVQCWFGLVGFIGLGQNAGSGGEAGMSFVSYLSCHLFIQWDVSRASSSEFSFGVSFFCYSF